MCSLKNSLTGPKFLGENTTTREQNMVFKCNLEFSDLQQAHSNMQLCNSVSLYYFNGLKINEYCLEEFYNL